MCLARFRAHGFLLGFDLDDGLARFGMMLWAELQKFTHLICAPAFYLIGISAVINADIERVSEISRLDALVCLAISRLDDLILGILVEMHTPQPRSGEELEDGFADAFGIKVHGNCHANHPGLLDFEVSFEQQFKSCGQGLDQIHFNLWRVKELGAFLIHHSGNVLYWYRSPKSSQILTNRSSRHLPFCWQIHQKSRLLRRNATHQK